MSKSDFTGDARALTEHLCSVAKRNLRGDRNADYILSLRSPQERCGARTMRNLHEHRPADWQSDRLLNSEVGTTALRI